TNSSLVDYNRTGTPLIEIVTEPDMRSPQEAYDYLTILKLTLQYLKVSDCDMEKGSLRCDANISIRPQGETKLGTKTELKNMNSFRAVKSALEFEANRQKEARLAGQRIIQETRLWNEQKAVTISMRSKEEAHDYRYFPEPDLVPFIVDDATVQKAQAALPELPNEKFARLIQKYALTEYDAQILIQDPDLADFFEQCTRHSTETKKICNWINGALLQELNMRKTTISSIKLKPEELADLIQKVDNGTLHNLAAKETLKHVIETGKSVAAIIQEKGLSQVSNEKALEDIVDQIIIENEKVVNQIREGKETALGFLVGQAMKKSQGKANPKKIGEIIRRRLQT
ncbi:MAG: Asp-tRNA(Asn)/Glu-tRNA(Gln) amidotransferase subunit GatB, partial [Candidatus Omnitrophota bacterium]